MKDIVSTLQEKLDTLEDDARGSEREVDLLNRLAWALVPVDIHRACALFEEAEALSKTLSYELGRARARFGSAYRDFFKADYGNALKTVHENAPILRERGEAEDRANILLLEGMVHWSLGDFEVALDMLHRCHEISVESDYEFAEGWSLTSMASIHESLGDYEKAVKLHRRAIDCFRKMGSTVGEGRALSGLGMAYLRKGQYERALDEQRKSLELHRSMGSELSAARALNDMGLTFQARGEAKRARECLEEALEIRERLENWPAMVTTLLALGKLENEAKNPAAAAEVLRRAVALAEKTSTRPKLWQAHEALSTSYELQGEFRRALRHQRAAQAIKEEVQGEEANTKLKNMQVRLEVATAEKEAELQRLKNVELAEALEQLTQAQSQLIQSEKMAAVGRLVAGVAHELNTPVATLVSGMDLQVRAASKIRELIEDSNPALERAFEALESGSKNAALASERIRKMVESLETFSQVDQSEFRRIDLKKSVESTIDLLRPHLGERVEVVTDLERLPEVECYPGALNQALMTLLVNASESIVDGGTIRVSIRSHEDRVRLSVSDTGHGIPKEEVEHLFEIGFSRKGPRVRMHAGLANVRSVVDKHHGEISVESQPGKGTTFEIVLPVRQPK